MHWAAWEGHKDMVLLLLSEGADAAAQSKVLGTPLHFAAIRGHAEIVRALLESGAGPDATAGFRYEGSLVGPDWGTPVHWAAAMGHSY